MKAEGKKPRKSLNESTALVTNRKLKIGAPFDRYKLAEPIVKPTSYDPDASYNWRDFLDQPDLNSPPVYVFPTAPLNNIWEHISPMMKIEVPNFEYQSFNSNVSSAYWIASVVKVIGYKLLLRYEGSTPENPVEFWMNLCCQGIHPIGWCAQNTKPLVPPKSIQDLHPEWRNSQEWKMFLAKNITGCGTLPPDFHERVQKALKSKFQVGMNIEVLNKRMISQVKPAVIKEVIGHRLRLAYTDEEGTEKESKSSSKDSDESSDDENEPEKFEFWAHERSPILHPVGWANTVGHQIECTDEYRVKCEKIVSSGKCALNDASPDLFPPWANTPTPNQVANQPSGTVLLEFRTGMKLEAVDPLDLSSVVVATVAEVLKDGYLMLQFDGTSDQFCYHKRSPYIFPIGFCEQNWINLKPPNNYGTNPKFSWPEYLKQTKSLAAPQALFNTELVTHHFEVGQKLEATDLMDPHLVCVATIADVKGRLLRIHFDGWEDSFDQWVDCEAPEIYPLGWCEMVGLKLEAAKEETPVPPKKRVKPNNKPPTNTTMKKKSAKPPLASPMKEEQTESRPPTAGFSSVDSPTDVGSMPGDNPGQMPLPTSISLKASLPSGNDLAIPGNNEQPQ